MTSRQRLRMNWLIIFSKIALIWCPNWLLMQAKGTQTERLNEYESFGSSFLTVNIIHFITFCFGNMWHSPIGPKKHTLDWNQKEDRHYKGMKRANVYRQWISMEKEKAHRFIWQDLTFGVYQQTAFYFWRMRGVLVCTSVEASWYSADHPQRCDLCRNVSTPLIWLLNQIINPKVMFGTKSARRA